jgi:hypothetical protein
MLLARPSVGLHISPGPEPSCTYLCSHLPPQLTCSQMKTYGVYISTMSNSTWRCLLTLPSVGLGAAGADGTSLKGGLAPGMVVYMGVFFEGYARVEVVRERRTERKVEVCIVRRGTKRCMFE